MSLGRFRILWTVALSLVFSVTILLAQSRTPDLSKLSAAERQSIESACSAAKYLEGPAAYNRCLRNQLNALTEQQPNYPAPKGVPPTPNQNPPTDPRALPYKVETIPRVPSFFWPNWSGGLSRPIPS